MWAFANNNYIEHFLACHFRYGAHSCSLCSNYHCHGDSVISLLKSRAVVAFITILLLKPDLPTIHLIIALLLILLSGDVEINPGPSK